MKQVTEYEPLTEFSPIVSIERAVRQQYDDIDFDYEAFAEEAASLGISPENQGALLIEIKARGRGLLRGTYNKKHIMTVAKPTVNKHLMHELKHAADDITGELRYDTRFWIGKIGMATAVLPAAAAGGGAAEYIAGNGFAGDMLNGVGIVGTIACAVAIIYGYVRHPDEVRADAVAEQSQAHIIKLRPLPGQSEPEFDMMQEAEAVFRRFCRSF